MPSTKEPEHKRYRVNVGINYVVKPADHQRIQDSNDKEPINPFDPEHGIEMKRVEPGRTVHLPDHVAAGLKHTKAEVDGQLVPVIEEVTSDDVHAS